MILLIWVWLIKFESLLEFVNSLEFVAFSPANLDVKLYVILLKFKVSFSKIFVLKSSFILLFCINLSTFAIAILSSLSNMMFSI